MKRRNFVHKSALGIAGLNIISPAFGSQLMHTTKVHEWLKELVKATSSYAVPGLFFPVGLHDAIAEKTPFFVAKGFKPVSGSVYFYRDSEEYCFYPLGRDHESSDMTEMVLLFFYRTSKSGWKQFKTFNSYQLEALTLAAKGLTGRSNLKEELLPVVNNFTNNFPQKFSSSLNQIDIVTVLSHHQGVKTTISITCIQGERIFQENFSSAHCLTCTPLNS